MGKFCEVCGKGVVYGNNVSHSVRRDQPYLGSQHAEGSRAGQRCAYPHVGLHSLPAQQQG